MLFCGFATHFCENMINRLPQFNFISFRIHNIYLPLKRGSAGEFDLIRIIDIPVFKFMIVQVRIYFIDKERNGGKFNKINIFIL